jgi:alpha-1,3-glucosyltransferase
MGMIVSLAIAVLLTFAGLLYPIYFAGSFRDVFQVFVRLFPVARGLYEDKVANIWCALSVVLKLRDMYPLETLVHIRYVLDISNIGLMRDSAVSTFVACLPSCWFTFRKANVQSFLYAMASISLAFFLLSFQVHEKSILLPVLPMILLYLNEPVLADWFVNTAMFSMYHMLLQKDQLQVPYIALILSWNCLTNFAALRQSHGFTRLLVVVCKIIIVDSFDSDLLVIGVVRCNAGRPCRFGSFDTASKASRLIRGWQRHSELCHLCVHLLASLVCTIRDGQKPKGKNQLMTTK